MASACDKTSTDEFPFSSFQMSIDDASNRLTGVVKQCAKSAFVHLRKAWLLRELDKEMAAFRAITAEEEATTAIIQALKLKRYD